MIDNPPILTIHRGWSRAPHDLLAEFRGAQTSHLVDAMDGRGALDWRIKPLDPGSSFVGSALPAHAYPGDIAAMFGAVAEAQEGDAIVVACDGYSGTAVFGDLAAGMMRNKGVVAFVTDGLARDKAGILLTGLPVYCQGISPNSPALNGPGVVGIPVVCGGVQVCPGDIIVGDPDGVVVVPAGRARAVLARLAEIRAAEAVMERRVRNGLTLSDGAAAMVAAARVVDA